MLRSVFNRVPRATFNRVALITSPQTKQKLPAVSTQILNNFHRSISTTKTSLQATTAHSATQKDAEPNSISSYISHFGGWYPLVGLGSLIVISKEWLVINEELLLATNFAAFVFITWMAVGDSVNQMVADDAAQTNKILEDTRDIQIEAFKYDIKFYETQLQLGPFFFNTMAQYQYLISQLQEAQERKKQSTARETTLAKLNSIYQREQADQAAALNSLIEDAVSEARARVEGLSEEEKSRIIDQAIDTLGGNPTTDDPVAQVFQQYLASSR